MTNLNPNCGYRYHDFQKKGRIIKIDAQLPYEEERFIQEMECSKCGITTYYPSEAFEE